MSLKMECYSKWNVTQRGMLLKIEVAQNRISIKMEWDSKWNATQN